MKFTINIERKHFYFLAAIISVLGIFTVFAATPFNPSSPLHPLQQISLDENGIASVDADSNSIIDNSDKLQGLSASEFCKSNGLDCPNGSGGVWTTSGINIYYNTGNVGIGTTSPTQSLDVIGNILASGDIKASSITLGGVTRTTWPGTLTWSSPVASGTTCSLAGSELSGACSPEGSTNVYGSGFTGFTCGSPLEPEPELFEFTQTCVDAG